jgi:FixJ family two-component response regulator
MGQLTHCEREVMEPAATGRLNRQVANNLGAAERRSRFIARG